MIAAVCCLTVKKDLRNPKKRRNPMKINTY